MNSVDRETFLASETSWLGFPEQTWGRVKLWARAAGFWYAPTEDQREIVWRYMDDGWTRNLAWHIAKSRNWGQVVDRILGHWDTLDADAALRERDAEWAKRAEEQSRKGGMARVDELLTVIADSYGIVEESAA